ncbi:MAG: PAS domain S-box protein [Deltaproteobacteria bacterium]|nr:PAS domain S-box protein [Deltaproteobacteria bacterium]
MPLDLEALFQLVEAAPDPMLAVDAEGTIRLVSTQAEALFGARGAALLGQPVEALIPEAARGVHVANRRAYAADPRRRPMGTGLRIRALRADGTEVPVDVSLSPVTCRTGERLVLCSLRDMTAQHALQDELRAARDELEGRVALRTLELATANEQLRAEVATRQRAEEELRASQAELYANRDELQMILDCLGEGVVVADATGRVVLANPEAVRLLDAAPVGAARTEWQVRNEVLLAETREPVSSAENPMGRALRGESCDDIEFLVRSQKWPDGIVVAGSGRPLRDAGGVGRGGVVIFRDITERKRSEERIVRLNQELEERARELAAANERLTEVDRLKSQFLAMMSHELRTPMNSIIGFTGVLEQGLAGPLTGEQRKQLGIVRGAARHLLGLINDLLDLSRIESGKLVLSRERFELAAVVKEVQDVLRPAAEQKGLRFVVDLADAPPELVGDRRRVYQVLLNLANNAVKFTQRGEVRIVGRAALEQVELAVEDTGIGIRADQLHLLFEAFRQLDSSARRVYEGTGLGLHLCRRLLEAMGGMIQVESEPGRGSRFVFTVPLRPSETRPAVS